MAISKVKVFWKLVITSANNKINYRHLADGADRTATISAGNYYSIDSFLAAVKTAMDTASTSAGITWTITADDDTGLITFTASGGTSFTLKFNTGADASSSPRYILGFYAQDHASTGLALTSPKQHMNGWYSPTAVFRDTKPVFEEPNSVVTVSVAGGVKSISNTVLTFREVEFHFLEKEYTFIADEGSSTNSNKAIENWWRTGRGRFRYWPDRTVEGTYYDYFLDGTALEEGFVPQRMFIGRELYRVGPWRMRSYQS